MSVYIDIDVCNGCSKRSESFCEEICPGDLFFIKEGKAVLREPSDCWDCFACVKACPRSALSVELPFQISEEKNRLIARVKKNTIVWKLVDFNGNEIISFTIPNRKPETEGLR